MSRDAQGSNVDWQITNIPSNWRAIVHASSLGTGTGLWLIVGSDNYIATSTDTGATWTSRNSAVVPTSTISWNAACWTGSQFVVVGSDGRIITSSDGISWVAQTSGVSSELLSIAHSGSNYVAVSTSDILTSSNATSWSAASLPNGIDILYGVFWENSKFIASGRNDVIESSDNGSTWTQTLVSLDNTTVTYSSSLDIYVMMGNSGLTSSNLYYYTSTDGISWTLRNTSAAAGSVNIYDVKWHATDAIFVAVGSGGTIITSTNGTTWTARTSGTSSALYCSFYDESSEDIIVGGAADVLYSTTGTSWTAATSPGVAIYGISFHTFIYVLVGAGGAIYTSYDLSSYTSQTSGTSSTFYDIFFNDGTLCAVGAGGIFTSSDGTTWGSITTTSDYYKVLYANSRWYAVGLNITSTSTNSDASSWSTTTLPYPGNTTYYGVCHDGINFVASGNVSTVLTGASTTWTYRFNVDKIYSLVYASSITKYVVGSSGGILYSTDGATWTMGYVAPGSWSTGPSIIWTGSTLIASNNGVFTSTNATSWSAQTADASINYTGHSSSGVVGIGVSGSISTANTSGASWTPRITQAYNKIVKGGSTYVIGTDDYGMMLYGTDRLTWTIVNTTATGTITDLIWDGTNFVAITDNSSEILYSTNGSSWTVSATTGMTGNPVSIAWSGSIYCAVTEVGYSCKSTNKTTWTDPQLLGDYGLDIIWSSTHSLFVTVGSSGYVATSPDGITWTTRTSNTTAQLNAVVWCAELSLFVAVGNTRTVITSPDATTAWTVRTDTNTASGNMTSVAWSGTRLVAGSLSYTYTSTNAINWEYYANGTPNNYYTTSEVIYDGTRFIALDSTNVKGNVMVETSPH